MHEPQRNIGSTLSSGYRYSFNGKEKIDEVAGSGNSIDFGARIYDPRVGRWLSRDPLEEEYHEYSPYAFVLNTPLQAVDPDGKKVVFPNMVSQVQGQRYLEQLGLSDEFRINRNGIVKRRFTSLSKNDAIAREFLKKVKSNKEVYEVSYSNEENWQLSFSAGSETIMHYCGSRTTEINPPMYDDTGLRYYFTPDVHLVVITQSDIITETSQFIGVILGLDAENLVLSSSGRTEQESTTVCDIYSIDCGSMPHTTPDDINSYEIDGDWKVNVYWLFRLRTWSHKEVTGERDKIKSKDRKSERSKEKKNKSSNQKRGKSGGVLKFRKRRQGLK